MDLRKRLAEVEAQLADLQQRTDNAEHLANMGNYDWHIPSDTNAWSDQLYRIYGYEPQAFNASYEKFLSLIHPDDREKITAVHQQAYATGEPYQMIERIVRPDGEVRYLSSNGQVVMGEDGSPERMRGTCVDITDQVLAEQAREEANAKLVEANVRRRAAMEINDNVVQGLAAGLVALEEGEQSMAVSYVRQTLAAARGMMDDLLEPTDASGLRPGDLVRQQPATLAPPVRLRAVADEHNAEPAAHSVLLVDDAADLRGLYRLKFDKQETFRVVGEAGDGEEAVELARQLQPDLVVLDLAMPRMDGLEALPLILEAAPRTHVLVLSGFNEHTLAEKAVAAGARRYLVKGCSLNELIGAAEAILA